jgi:hypothetical protein
MKVKFEFNLPEENDEYKIHHHASDLYGAIWEYAEWIRGICKHGNPDEFNAEACRKKLYEILTEYNVDL